MLVPSVWITIGKKCCSKEYLARLVGDDAIAGIRINMGRCPMDWVFNVLTVLSSLSYPMEKVFLDIGNTKPRLRLTSDVTVSSGEKVTVATRYNEHCSIFVEHERFLRDISKGDTIIVSDGEIEFVVEDIQENISLRALCAGKLSTNVSVSIKGRVTNNFHVSEEEIDGILNIHKQFKTSLILSFVECVENIVWAKKVFKNCELIVPKIETDKAYQNIDKIVEYSSLIFLGRGDLGLDIGIEKIGVAQKRIIDSVKKSSGRIAVGTGILDSLKWNQTPLRAEVIDITNFCFENIDFIVLTSETAASPYPEKSLNALFEILNYIKSV